MSIQNSRFQRGPPPDPRRATRRAHQQPRTGVSDAIRGSCQQPRTGMRHATRGKSNQCLNVCTYNTRTINDLNVHARDTMLHEISDINWDVIGLSETKEKETKIEPLECGNQLFLSGNNTSRSNGVGFLVKKSLVSTVDEFDPISDRLAVLSIKGKFSKIVYIQCYFPTSSSSDDDITDMYDKLQALVDKVPKRDHLFIMGDFNAKLGKLHTNFPNTIGKHTLGNANDRGERLAEFCAANNLVVTNTLFKKRKLHTWTSPDGRTKNQIDFIITRKPSIRQSILDSSALNIPDISDHRLVRTKVRLSFSWPSKEKSVFRPDFDSISSDVVNTFQLKLTNRFAVLGYISDPESLFENVSATISEVASETFPSKHTSAPRWMSNNTKSAIDTKHKVRKTKGSSSIEYKVAKAESKKLVKKDRLKLIEDEIDKLSNLPPHKLYYATIKKLKAKARNISWGIKSKDDIVLTSKEDILERWAEFYEELYSDDSISPQIDDSREDPIPPILLSEIEHAISNLKNGKSPGLDNIYSEYIKAGGRPLLLVLHRLFNLILTTGTIPQAFKTALIVVLYKKGSRLDCGNYRPISLLSHVYKLFISIIASRVKSDLYASFPASQAAYQPGRGTIEQVIALEQIIEKSIEFNNPVFIAFIDFKKAFDSIKLDKLWAVLEKTGMNKRYINLLKITYDNSTAAIKSDIGTSRQIKILKGVKQGDILSALLFCIVIATIILKAESECSSGYSIGGHLLSNLSYADDIAAIAKSSNDLQKFLDLVVEYSAEVGLFVNVTKTECMTTDKNSPPLNITIYGKPIKQVSEFVYLGHKLSSTNDGTAAVKHRIGLGWAAFEKNKTLLTSRRVPQRIKSKIYTIYVLTVILYGLECVNWTTKLLQSAEVFQNHIMRFMTNHRLLDHIPIIELRRTTNLLPISSIIKSKVLKLYGHIKRSQIGLSKLALEGMVEGKRSRGGQRKRWRDNVSDWSGYTTLELNRLSQDRDLWKRISHVSAHSAVGGDSDI